jgi:hypothetical protein
MDRPGTCISLDKKYNIAFSNFRGARAGCAPPPPPPLPPPVFSTNKKNNTKTTLFLFGGGVLLKNIVAIEDIIIGFFSILQIFPHKFRQFHKVINKNKMSCYTPCPCISSVREQYSKILHNISTM